jgi:hypothetical protein
MPLWRIYSHSSTFSTAQREGLAKSITSLYVNVGLPAFYVNVLFIDTNDNSAFVSGKATNNFVRITVEQIARAMPDPGTPEGAAFRKRWMDIINEVSLMWFVKMWSSGVWGRQKRTSDANKRCYVIGTERVDQ